MFIRKVTHINKRNAVEYHTYKLVESLRTQAGPRQLALSICKDNKNNYINL